MPRERTGKRRKILTYNPPNPLGMKIKLILVAYAINVLQNFTLIHIGSGFLKLKSTIKLGVLVSPVVMTTDKIISTFTTWTNISVWIIDNSDYIQLVLGAVAVDHILGSIKHAWFTRDFSIKKNLTGIMIKLGLVVACGFLFEGLNHLVDSDAGTVAEYTKEYLTITTRCIVFLYPAGSAFSNSSVISGGKFPPVGWMDKLKRFQQNLNAKDLHTPNDPNPPQI